MTPPLPIEAQERALDHLWNDPPSLCKCALVCKNWSPRCRHLLYTSFWIHDRRTVDVIATCSHTKQQLDSLYSIEVIQEEGDPYWHIVPSLFGARMDTMRVMKFAHMDWTKCRPHSTYFILMGQAKSLTQLFLYDCTFRAFSDLRHILSNLQSLADLRMNRITWSGPNVVVPATPSSAKRPVARPPLRRLLLRGFSLVNLRTLLIWLLESRMPSIWEIPYLELISMDSEIQDENVSEIAKFLTVLWPSAVHLGVSDWAVDVVKSINVQAPNHVCYDMCCEKENGMSCARMKVLLYDDGYKMSSRLPTHVSSLWAKKFNFAGSYLAAPTGHYYTHQYDDVIYSRVHHVALTPDCSNSNARVRCFSPDGYYIAIYGCHNGSSRIGQSSENLRTWDIQIWNVASRTIIKSLTKQLSAAISQRKISIGGPIHIEHLYDIFKKTKTDAKSRWGLSRRMILRTFRKIIDQASEAKLMQLKRHKIFKEMMTIIELQDSWREIREHLALHPCAMRTELQSELTHLVMREILRAILYADRPPQSESMDLKICQIFMELASEEPQAKFVESETREIFAKMAEGESQANFWQSEMRVIEQEVDQAAHPDHRVKELTRLMSIIEKQKPVSISWSPRSGYLMMHTCSFPYKTVLFDMESGHGHIVPIEWCCKDCNGTVEKMVICCSEEPRVCARCCRHALQVAIPTEYQRPEVHSVHSILLKNLGFAESEVSSMALTVDGYTLFLQGRTKILRYNLRPLFQGKADVVKAFAPLVNFMKPSSRRRLLAVAPDGRWLVCVDEEDYMVKIFCATHGLEFCHSQLPFKPGDGTLQVDVLPRDDIFRFAIQDTRGYYASYSVRDFESDLGQSGPTIMLDE